MPKQLTDSHSANVARYWGSYAVPQGGLRLNLGQDHGFATDIPISLFNPVILADGSGIETIHAEMAEAITRHGASALWWVGRNAQSEANHARLVELGLEPISATPAMHFPLADFTPKARPEDLEIATVTGPEARREWAYSMCGWFGFFPAMREAVAKVEVRIPEEHLEGQYRFVGRYRGRPVAACTLVISDGLAGIYSVTTDLDYREKGIGRAMVENAMAVGKAAGASAAILQSSSMGLSVYQGIGFTTDFEYRCYRQTALRRKL